MIEGLFTLLNKLPSPVAFMYSLDFARGFARDNVYPVNRLFFNPLGTVLFFFMKSSFCPFEIVKADIVWESLWWPRCWASVPHKQRSGTIHETIHGLNTSKIGVSPTSCSLTNDMTSPRINASLFSLFTNCQCVEVTVMRCDLHVNVCVGGESWLKANTQDHRCKIFSYSHAESLR